MKHSKENACLLEHKNFYAIPPKRQGRIGGLFCKTHKADCCRCGAEWGKHTEEKDDYKKNLKSFCVSCYKDLKNSMAHYLVFGNFCKSCSGRSAKRSKGNKKRQ